jgi:hypothetical protein
MNIQYISNNVGQTTGVFIPIEDWEALKDKYEMFKNEEQETVNLTDWHKAILDQRLAKYKSNPDDMLDFDQVCDEIEKEL